MTELLTLCIVAVGFMVLCAGFVLVLVVRVLRHQGALMEGQEQQAQATEKLRRELWADRMSRTLEGSEAGLQEEPVAARKHERKRPRLTVVKAAVPVALVETFDAVREAWRTHPRIAYTATASTAVIAGAVTVALYIGDGSEDNEASVRPPTPSRTSSAPETTDPAQPSTPPEGPAPSTNAAGPEVVVPTAQPSSAPIPAPEPTVSASPTQTPRPSAVPQEDAVSPDPAGPGRGTGPVAPPGRGGQEQGDSHTGRDDDRSDGDGQEGGDRGDDEGDRDDEEDHPGRSEDRNCLISLDLPLLQEPLRGVLCAR